VILLLSMDKDGLRAKSTLNVYGMPKDFKQDWTENGEQRLTWDTSPSASDVASLPFLGQVEVDNGGGIVEGQTDSVRVFGTALDDYIRQSDGLVTILVVRTNSDNKETRFIAREGKVEQSPALAIRKN
jgi:hypothetical protein